MAQLQQSTILTAEQFLEYEQHSQHSQHNSFYLGDDITLESVGLTLSVEYISTSTK